MANGKHLILVRGVSGCGKSTIAGLFNGLVGSSSIASFSTDDLFMVDGEYKFDPSKLSEFHARNINNVEEHMKNVLKDRINHSVVGEIGKGDLKDYFGPGDDIILVHNTFTEDWEMKPYYYLAKQYSWMIHTVIVENRHKSKSIHDVPDNVLEAQKSRFNIAL